MISFIVPGEPKAQGRPRFFIRRHVVGKQKLIGSFDPRGSSDFKRNVALFAKKSGVSLSTLPAHLLVSFYASRPLRLMRKSDANGPIPCPCRPDLDNYIKAILDGLNGVAWKDDGQVYSVNAAKWYHEKGGSPRTEITILFKEPLEAA